MRMSQRLTQPRCAECSVLIPLPRNIIVSDKRFDLARVHSARVTHNFELEMDR
jgi:hypothetical protein